MAPAELSPPHDLSHHFSRTTNNREASAIKKFYRFFEIPGIGNLAGGKLFLFSYNLYYLYVSLSVLPHTWYIGSSICTTIGSVDKSHANARSFDRYMD